MTPDMLSHEIYVTLMAGAQLAGPPLAISAALGLFIGLLQAVTQIQDQSFPQVIKIVVISGVLFGLGARLAGALYTQTVYLLTAFPRLVH